MDVKPRIQNSMITSTWNLHILSKMVKDSSKCSELTMFSQEEVYGINNSTSGCPASLDFIHPSSYLLNI